MGRKDRRRRQRLAKKAAVAGEGLDPAAALTHHQAGRIAQAERIYGQILAARPNNADALHLLGVAAHQTGRHDRAITFIEKAVRHASASAFAAMTAPYPVTSRSPDRTGVRCPGQGVPSARETTMGQGFPSPYQPDKGRSAIYRTDLGPDSYWYALCTAIVGNRGKPSGESR